MSGALAVLALAAGAALAAQGAAPPAAPAPAAPAPAPACALPPPHAGVRPWRTGETMVLDLDVLGVVKTGLLELSVEPPMSRGRVVPLRARARTTATVGELRPVTAVAISWVDARTLRPERYRDDSEEGGLRRSTDTRFPRRGGRLEMAWRTGDRSGRRELAAGEGALDAVSALYALRAARLAPGDRICFEAIGRGRLWRVEGTVAPRREPVETPAGRFETVRVDLRAVRTDKPDAEMGIHLWIGTDPRRLLVAAVGELDFGPVRAQLSAVRGAAPPG